jgi:SAM-dependent methyltransferase
MSTEGHSRDALRWATDAHYEDAERYDRTYRLRRHDVAFYREMAAEHGGPVLELGVGTGRVALALARDGHDVVGLERMAPMLAKLRARLAKEPAEVRARVRLVRGDIRRFSMPAASAGGTARKAIARFPLVIAPFNVLMHLYRREELEQMLASVRAHLAPRGVFVLDVRMPDIRSFTRDPERAFKCPRLKDPSDGTVWDTAEIFQYDAVTQVQMITSTFREVAEPHRAYVKPLAHRQFFPQELELLLHYNGFSIRERWGDFERGPQHVDCETQVIVASLRAPRGRNGSTRR